MRQANPYRMPEGLPTHFSSDKEGFDALCALLSISTTRQKHAVLNAQMFKQALKTKASKVSRHAKTSERVRQGLSALYGDPDLRRNLWRTVLSHDEEPSDPARRPIPSIEHEVLQQYDDQVFDQEPEAKDLSECSDYCSAETLEDEWRAAAVVALPRIRNDVLQWGELSRERQDAVLMAAFATSTLLDDVRLLRWVAERVDKVSNELPFVGLGADPSLSENQSKPKPDENSPPEGDVLSELRTTANNLSAVALRLAKNSPEDELFDKVSEYAGRIARMREASLQEKAANKVEAQLDQFNTVLSDVAAHVPWLADSTGEFLSNWRKALSEGTETEVQDLQIALDLAMQNAPPLAQDWVDATTKKEQARLSLKALEDAEDNQFSSVDDRETKEDEYHAEIAKRGREARKSRNNLLQALRLPVSEDDEAEGPAESVVETPRGDAVPKQESSPPEDATPTIEPPLHASDDSGTAEPDSPAPASVAIAESQAQPGPADQDEPAPPPEIDGKESAETLQEEAVEPFSEMNRSVWTALQQGRPGLAHRIARLNAAAHDALAHPTPDLLAAVALGSQISSSDGRNCPGVQSHSGRRSLASRLRRGRRGDQRRAEPSYCFGVVTSRTLCSSANGRHRLASTGRTVRSDSGRLSIRDSHGGKRRNVAANPIGQLNPGDRVQRGRVGRASGKPCHPSRSVALHSRAVISIASGGGSVAALDKQGPFGGTDGTHLQRQYGVRKTRRRDRRDALKPEIDANAFWTEHGAMTWGKRFARAYQGTWSRSWSVISKARSALPRIGFSLPKKKSVGRIGKKTRSPVFATTSATMAKRRLRPWERFRTLITGCRFEPQQGVQSRRSRHLATTAFTNRDSRTQPPCLQPTCYPTIWSMSLDCPSMNLAKSTQALPTVTRCPC